MEIQQHLYDIDDLWRMVCEADDDKRYELIEGEIIEMAPPGGEHGTFAGEIYYYIRLFNRDRSLGIATVETGYHPPGNRSILLSPDVAFTRIERAPQPFPKTWVPIMPDLAVEIKSPSNTMTELRRKAAIYLERGTQLVWIVLPDAESVEVHRLGADGEKQREVIGPDGQLSGEDVLPDFSLALSTLYA